jgi:hypothetical protein
MANSYFTLKTSSIGDTGKKFSVLQSGYSPMIYRTANVQPTIDGKIDVTMGAVFEKHEYVVKVRQTEDRSDYGSLSDLQTLYRLNNPNATPSNVLKLTDHFGSDHNVVMMGEFTAQFVGTMIEGETAWAMVKCLFQFIPA